MDRICRREFLRISALTTAATVVAACATPAPEAPAEVAGPPPAAPAAPVVTDRPKEPPALAEAVQAGQLPPLDERLPVNPIVLDPVEEIGQYGGTWRWVSVGDGLGWQRMANYVEPFLKWNRTATGHIANLLESWHWNDEGTELVANLRRGIKWSDGADLTVNDYLFWWEELVGDASVPIREPAGTRVRGELMEVVKGDDYTLNYTFAYPNPLFLEYHSRGFYHSAWFMVPSHYLKQFHFRHNTAIAADDTTELLDHYNFRDRHPDMPTYTAWKVTEFRSGERALFDRNPYYWKVDPQGSQLPYINGIDVTIVAHDELVVMKATAGELDCHMRALPVRDIPLLQDSAERGDYRVILWEHGDFGWPLLILGYDYPDEEIVDLMYDKRFRQALSWAINRPRINDIVALGLATPRQAALSSGSPEFKSPEGQQVYKEWAESYAEFRPETAAQLLDEIGVVDSDNDGWRERPNGKPLELIVDLTVVDIPSLDSMDLIKEDWESIGLKTTLNVIDGTLVTQRANDGEYMIWARGGGSSAWGLISAAPHWTPVEYAGYAIAPRIGLHYQTGGREGVPPRPGSALEQLQEAYTELISIVDPAERERRLLQAYRIHIDDGPVNIGVLADHPSPVVINNKLRNVPDFGVVGPWDLGYFGTVDPQQFFFKT